MNNTSTTSAGSNAGTVATSNTSTVLDGTEMRDPVTVLRFGSDRRVEEVRKMLGSSSLLNVYLPSNASLGHNDQDVVAMQQDQLQRLVKRRMSSCIGRGMLTFGTSEAMLTEPISVPPLVVQGRLVSSKVTLSLDATRLLPEHLWWPQFHNGVSAALSVHLQLGSLPSHILGSWVAYNKSSAGDATHAGLLLGLGLLTRTGAVTKENEGGLQNNQNTRMLDALPLPVVYDYLSNGHELTSIGLLLGTIHHILRFT
jgi:anaphase-promoting complex subunit 1